MDICCDHIDELCVANQLFTDDESVPRVRASAGQPDEQRIFASKLGHGVATDKVRL